MTNGHKIKITNKNKEMYGQAVGNKTVMKLGNGNSPSPAHQGALDVRWENVHVNYLLT